MVATVTDTTRVEQFNQSVRATCVLLLTAAFVIAYLIGVWRGEPTIADSTYVGVLTLALTWWFKSRDEKKDAPTNGHTTQGPASPHQGGSDAQKP